MNIREIDDSQFGESRYPKQFSISMNPARLFKSWLQTPFLDVTVNSSPELPITHVRALNKTVAIVLGWFTYKDEFYCSSGTLILSAGVTLEALYDKMCGRFLIVAINDGCVTVTADPGGLLSIVFDTETHTLASTPAILEKYRAIRQDRRIIDGVTRADGTIWYPFGLVPYADVERLQPGHALSILTGATTRRKTTPLKEQPSRIAASLTRTIFDRVTRSIKAIAAKDQICAHLTAGYDSRMVLAACLNASVSFRVFTIRSKSKGSRLDCDIARLLARKNAIDHEIIVFLAPSQREVDEWLSRTSHCVKDAVTFLCRTVRETDNGDYTLTGTCGEVGRAFYWQRDDLQKYGLSPESLITRLGFQKTAVLLEASQEWLEHLAPGLRRTEILDRAYIEHRLGDWASPSIYGHNIEKPTISPFNNWSNYRDMLSLPAEYRFYQHFAEDFISSYTPELLKLPFNRATGYRRFFYLKKELKSILPIGALRSIRSKFTHTSG